MGKILRCVQNDTGRMTRVGWHGKDDNVGMTQDGIVFLTANGNLGTVWVVPLVPRAGSDSSQGRL